MAEPTLYWHDYETFGIDPRRDRPSQFAGVRTDLELNIIDDPLVVYCKPPSDYLPQPEACLLTGLTPQFAEQNGLIEADFIRQIHEQLSQPNTCALGYNSIRFDDEFTRNALYRNFYDPYAREWQQGNSRWDLIDVVRASKALRPDGINWPTDEDGRSIFKLEALTKANHISHEAAHDALSDVYATIAFAKLIKSRQPKLYQYLWQHKTKAQAHKLLQLGSFNPLVHISGRFPSAKDCLAVVLPICQHPTNANGIMVYDLSIDPEPLLTLNTDEIRRRVFTAVADLPEGVERVPLKTVHVNKSPVLAPINVLKEIDQVRLNLDLSTCYRHLDLIKRARYVAEKIADVFSAQDIDRNAETDPDLMIYTGGFFHDKDKAKMLAIRAMTGEQLKDYSPKFIDSRLNEMLFRYRARNYPECLNVDEIHRWQQHCKEKLIGTINQSNSLNFEGYLAEIARLKQTTSGNEELLSELENYARALKISLMQ